MYEIAVVVIEDQHVGVSGAGRSEEATSGIREDLAGGGLTISLKEMGLASGWKEAGCMDDIVAGANASRWGRFFSSDRGKYGAFFKLGEQGAFTIGVGGCQAAFICCWFASNSAGVMVP